NQPRRRPHGTGGAQQRPWSGAVNTYGTSPADLGQVSEVRQKHTTQTPEDKLHGLYTRNFVPDSAASRPRIRVRRVPFRAADSPISPPPETRSENTRPALFGGLESTHGRRTAAAVPQPIPEPS